MYIRFSQQVISTIVLLLLSMQGFAQEPDKEKEQNSRVKIKQAILDKYKTSHERLKPFSEQKLDSEAYNHDLNKENWVNPAPGIGAFGLDTTQLENLVADRIVMMMHAPQDVDVPYYGEMIRWKNARFVTAVTELPMSAQTVRQLIIDNDQKDGWKDVEPFVRETNVLYRHEANQIGLHYKIQAIISIIRINGNIYIRNRYEENGDITSLFLTGDIGIALGVVPIIPTSVLSPLTVANVRRWEFIPVDDKRSFLAITDWAEVMDNTHLSKRMSQYDENSTNLGGISDENLVGPYPSVAANLNNFKNTVLKIKQAQETQSIVKKPLLEKGQTPVFIGSLDKQLVQTLSENGPLVFLHPRQDIRADYGQFPLHFVTAVFPVDAGFEDLRRYSAQMNHYADYVPQLDSSELAKGSFDIPDFSKVVGSLEAAEVKLNMKLGKGLKFISSIDIDYRLRYVWETPQRLAFERVGDGDIDTIHGAVEWLPGAAEDTSLLFYTSASDMGPKPKFPLNLSQHIPSSDVISGVIISVMAVGRQGPWVEFQLEQEAEARSRPQK